MLKRAHEFAFWTRFHVFAGACVFNMDVLVSKHNVSYQVLHPIREMVKQTYQFAFSPCMGLISFVCWLLFVQDGSRPLVSSKSIISKGFGNMFTYLCYSDGVQQCPRLLWLIIFINLLHLLLHQFHIIILMLTGNRTSNLHGLKFLFSVFFLLSPLNIEH